jgi:hypothetical protein
MTNHDDTPPLHPILRMRFGSELNAPRPGDTPPRRVKVEAEPAANDDAKPSSAPETSS